jgi:hypothetical protein
MSRRLLNRPQLRALCLAVDVQGLSSDELFGRVWEVAGEEHISHAYQHDYENVMAALAGALDD